MRESLRDHLFSPIAFLQTLLLSLLILLVLVFTTPIGPAFIGKIASSSVENLDIKGFSGTFLSQLKIDRLKWKDPSLGIEVEGVTLKKPRFDTSNKRFYSPSAEADRFVIRLPKSDDSPAEKITSLPDFSLPINLKVDALALKSFEIIRENKTLFEIKNIVLTRANIEKGKLTARAFKAEPIIIGAPLKVALNNINMGMNQPHNMRATGTINYQQPQVGKLVSDIDVSGTLTAYRFKLNGALDNKQAGFHNIQLEGAGDYDQVKLSRITTKSADGNINGKGKVTWTPDITWLFDGKAQQVKLAKYVPDWPAQFDASLNYQGGYKHDSLSGTLNLHSLVGHLKNKKITASGQLQHLDQDVNVKNILAHLGNNKVQLNGKASPPFNMSWDINASELNQLLPQLSGTLIAKGSLKGSLDQPILNANIDAKDIKYQAYQLGSAHLVAQTKQGIYSLRGRLKNLDLDQQKISNATIDASGKIDNHRVKLALTHSEAKVQLQAQGGWKNQQWQGVIKTLQLDTKQLAIWRLQKPVHITATKNSVKSSQFCLANHSASSCSAVNWSTAGGVNVEGKLQRTPLALFNPWLPKGLQLKGSANGHYNVRQVNGKPVGEVAIQLPASAVVYTQGKHKQTLDYKALTLKAVINGHKITANAHLILKNRGELSTKANIILSQKGGSPKINASGKLTRIPLLMVKPWLPNTLQLNGVVNGRYKVQVIGGKTLGEATLNLPSSSLLFVDANKKQKIDYKFITLQASTKDGNKITANAHLILKNRGELSSNASIILSKKGGDPKINASGKLTRIPLAMARPWLPRTLQPKGVANGRYKVQLIGSNTVGEATLNLPPSSLILGEGKDKQHIDYKFVTLKAAINGRKITASTRLLLKNKGELTAGAKIILAKRGNQHQISANGRISRLPLLMAQPWLPNNLKLKGSVNGSFKIAQQRGKNVGNVTLQLPNNSVVYIDEEGTKTTFDYHNASITAKINDKTILSNAKVQLDNRGNLVADAKITLGATSNAHRIQGTATFDMPNIRWIQPFIPHTSNLAGRISSNIAFNGRLLSPKITGKIALKQASIKLPEVGTYLRHINLSIQANDANKAIINGSLSSGAGKAKISGYLSLRDIRQLKGEMKIIGSNLQFVNTHEARGLMDPNITVKITPKTVEILGKVHIPNAQITLNAIPESTIKESEDVIVIGEKKPDGQYSALKIRPNIKVTLGNQVSFKGFGLDTKLGGTIHVSHNRQDITTQGSVKIIEGRYQAYGQNLVINNGRLVFNGPPSVIGMDIKAVRTIDNIKAGIHLTGTLLNPKTKLFSTPSLSESNILSYLLTGQALSDITGSQTALLMQAVRSLNVSNGDGLLRSIGNSLGLDDLSFVAKDDLKKSEIRLGKKLGSRTYVRYIVGLFDSMQKIAIDYKVNKYLNLEAQAGADAQSIDLIYKIETN